MACNLRTARSAAEEQGGLRIRRRPPQSVQHGCCVCFRRYILNNKAAHIAERAMCAASHKQARGDVGESKKNRSIQIGCFDWSEWRDLNSRPLDPQSSALPAAPHPDSVVVASATCVIIQDSNWNVNPFFKIFFIFPAGKCNPLHFSSRFKWVRHNNAF